MRWRIFPNHSGGANVAAIRADGAEVTMASTTSAADARQRLKKLQRKYGCKGE